MKRLLLLFGILSCWLTARSQTYCTSSLYTTGCTSGDVLDGISLGSYSDAATGCGTNGYEDHTSTIIPLTISSTPYVFSATTTYSGNEYFGVYIDWNDDGDFDDSGELVLASTTSYGGANPTYTDNLLIDNSRPLGVHRMRVRMIWNSPIVAGAACTSYTWGEIHDYSVEVKPNIVGGCANYFSQFNIDSVTATTAKVDWTPGTGNSSYYLEYGVSGFTPGSGTKLTGTYPASQPPLQLTGLTASTTYDIYFGEICNSGADTAYFFSPQTLTTTVPCPAPTSFAANASSSTTANVSWVSFSATSFEIIYGASGFDPKTAGVSQNASGSSHALASLSSNTLYDVYIIADCGSGGFSDTAGPVSFRTPCVIATAPFSESFDDTTSWVSGTGSNNQNSQIDPCWTRSPDMAIPNVLQWGTRNGAPASGNGPTVDVSGGNFMYAEASFGVSGNKADLISPPIDVSNLAAPSLSFFQHRYSAGGAIADMYVLVSNDFGASWDTVYNVSGEIQSAISDAWDYQLVNLGPYTGDTIMVNFHQSGNGCCGDAALDSIVIDELPSCLWPTSFNVTMTSHNSAILNWTDTTSATSWDLIWGPPGFNQASPGASSMVATSNPDTITGLVSNTDYQVYIRAKCGSSDSRWVGPLNFSTECSALTATYTNNFDNEVSGELPQCWSSYKKGPGGATSTVYTLSTTASFSTPQVLYLYNAGGSSGTDTTMAITPRFSDLGAGDKQIRFKAYSTSTSTLGRSLIIGTVTENEYGNTFSVIDTLDLSTSYQEFTVDFTTASGYNGTDEYIALLHGGNTTFQTIYIDDFNYEVIPSCAPPSSLSLGVDFVGSFNASLFWGQGQGDSTLIEVGTNGFTPGTGAMTFSGGTVDTFIVANGLQPQTAYEFYVKDTCYMVGGSGWIGPFAFTTGCLPVSAPYTETFDGTSWGLGNGSGSQTGTVDPCWTRSPEGNATWTWSVYNSTTGSGSTGPAADFSGSGNYLYTDASYSNTSFPAEIYSPYIDVSSLTTPYVKFYYFRYGDIPEMGDMEVAVNDGSGWVTLMTLTGTDQTANTDPWKETGLDVSSFGDTIQVRFSGLAKTCCQGDMAIDQFSVEEAPSCPNLSGLNITQLVDTAATLNWLPSGNATGYQIWVGPQSFYQGTTTVGGQQGLVGSNSYILDTLSANTCYEFLVRAICGPGDTSNWAGPVSFCTPCSPETAPYFETFDLVTTGLAGDFGNCWTGTGTTSSYSWRSNSGATGSASTGPVGDATSGSGVYMYTEASNGVSGDTASLLSPLVDISNLTTPEMRFSYHMYGANIDTLYVDIYDGTWHRNVFQLDEQQQSASTDAWKDTAISLVPYSSGGLVQARFRLRSRGCCPGDAAIDDVEFDNPITCPAPSNLTLGSVTSSSATINWSGNSSAVHYIIEYGPGGFTPGTGTVVTTTNTNYTLSSLPQNNTAMEAYVRAYCGMGDTSMMSGPLLIRIKPNLCTDNFEAYNTGNIDGQSTLFLGWAGDGGDGEVTTARAASGSKSLHIHTGGPNGFSDIVAEMDTSFTSGIYSLKWNMFVPTTFGGYYNILHNYTGATNVWAIEVYIDANGTATVNQGTNGTGVIGTYTTTPNSWNKIEHIIDLDNDTAWVLVNGVNANIGWEFSLGSTNMADRFNAVNFYSAANAGQTPKYYVDDFCVEPYVPVTCPEPTTLNVSSTNVGCDSAEVSWNSLSGNNSSLLEYGPTGFTPGSGTLIPFINSPHVLSGLTNGTTYDFYVADTCGVNDTSSWAGPFTFSTKAAPVAHASFSMSSTFTATTQDVTFDASGSSNADTYTWDFGNGTTGSGSNPAAVSYGLPNSSITVKLTVTNSCGSTDDTTITFNTSIGVDEILNAKSFNIYPNPSNGTFRLEVSLPGDAEPILSISEMSGKVLYHENIELQGGQYEKILNLQSLPKGVYLLSFETEYGKLSRRLIIQ